MEEIQLKKIILTFQTKGKQNNLFKWDLPVYFDSAVGK